MKTTHTQKNPSIWVIVISTFLIFSSCGKPSQNSSMSEDYSKQESWITSLKNSFDMEPATLTNDEGSPLKIPAGRRFTATVKFPLNLDEDIDSETASNFSVSASKHTHSIDDAVHPYLNDSEYFIDSFPVEFVALRASFPLENEQELYSDKGSISESTSTCVDAMALPSRIPEHRHGKLTSTYLVGKVLRICLQQMFEYNTLKSYQRTFMLGAYHCLDEDENCITSYTGDWVSKKKLKAFQKEKEVYLAEFSQATAELNESFRKSEVAYDKFYKTLPITTEGQKMLANHVMFGAVAGATATLPYWTQFFAQAITTAISSAAQQIFLAKEKSDTTATKQTVDHISQKAARDVANKSLATGYLAYLSKGGNGKSVKIPTATSDIFAAVTYIIVGLLVDYYNGELEPGVYAKDSSIPEDIVERIANASLAVVSYRLAQVLAKQSGKAFLGKLAGPAAGALRYSATIVFYEVAALAHYTSFLENNRIEEAKTKDFLNKKRLVAELDFEHTAEVYKIYLVHSQKQFFEGLVQ